MKTILITSIGSATAVNLLKLLKEEYTIVATDSNPYGYTAGSMMADMFYQLPLATNPNYISSLLAVIKKEDVALIIPIHDEEVRTITRNRSLISVPVLVSSDETIKLFNDKWQSAKYVQQLGVEVPKIKYDNDTFVACIKRMKQGVGSNGIEIYKTGQQIPVDLLKSDYETENYFVQELIEGVEYTVDVAADKNGKPFLIIPRQRVEVKAGVATKVRIVKDEKLVDLVEKIYANMCIPGFSNVQFIRSGEHYYFIELNCRYGGMSISSSLAAHNYPLELVAYYIDGAELPQGINQFPIKWNALVTRYYEEKIYEA